MPGSDLRAAFAELEEHISKAVKVADRLSDSLEHRPVEADEDGRISVWAAGVHLALAERALERAAGDLGLERRTAAEAAVRVREERLPSGLQSRPGP